MTAYLHAEEVEVDWVRALLACLVAWPIAALSAIVPRLEVESHLIEVESVQKALQLARLL